MTARRIQDPWRACLRCLSAAACVLLSSVCVGTAYAQPGIRAHVIPAPNLRGWHNTDVTIEFECSGVTSCPTSVTLSNEGAGQRVSQSVTDDSGRRADVTVVVNIDKTAAEVAIGALSNANLTSQSVHVVATASDLGSGVIAAACNGRPAALFQGSVTCDVLLHDGQNDVVVSVVDAAGNCRSVARALTLTTAARSLEIVPTKATMSVGDRMPLQLVDNGGRGVKQASWSVADQGVAHFSGDGVPLLVATAAGETIVTASWQGLSVQMPLVVLAGPLPWGTMRWAIGPTAGFKGVFAPRIRSYPGGPDMFNLELSTDGTVVRARALTDQPAQLWLEWPAVAASERMVKWMGDQGGGALMLLQSNVPGGSSAVVRMGRPVVGPLWRYESAGRLADDWAMDWRGTLYVVETPADGYPRVVAIDGVTGVAKFRIPVPRGEQRRENCLGVRSRLGDPPAVVGPPTIPDGIAFATQFVVSEDIEVCVDGQPSHSVKRVVYLMRVQPDGTSESHRLAELETSYPAPAPLVTLHQTLPDGKGGLLSLMQATWADGASRSEVVRSAESGLTTYTLPAVGEYALGQDWAFTTDGKTLVAFEPETGRVGWTYRTPEGVTFHIMFALEGGGVLVQTSAGVARLASDGSIEWNVPELGKLMDIQVPTHRR